MRHVGERPQQIQAKKNAGHLTTADQEDKRERWGGLVLFSTSPHVLVHFMHQQLQWSLRVPENDAPLPEFCEEHLKESFRGLEFQPPADDGI